MKKIDFEALFRTSPYPNLVMDTELIIVDANDAYLRSTGATRTAIVGKYVFDAFPPNPDDPASTSVAAVKGSLEKAIATGLPDTTPFLRYAVPRNRIQSSDDAPEFDERYWSTTSTPILDESGKVVLVVQHPIDVTDLYSLNKTSQVASVDSKIKVAQDAEHFNRAQMHEAMLRILHDERGHMRNLFNQAPGFIAVLTGPNHVFEMVNEAYYQLVGHRDIVGQAVWDALPDLRGQGFEALLNDVYQTGKVWVGRSIPLSIQPVPEGPLVARYVDLLYQPVFDAQGNVSGIFAQGHDVTEAVESQAAHRETEERLRDGMMAAKMVVWDWQIADGNIDFSDNTNAVIGGVPETIDEFIRFLHIDDQPRAMQANARAIADKNTLQETLRLVRPDNQELIWIEVRGKVRCDKQGTPVALRGVLLDITERMLATEKLRLADRQKDEFLAMLAHELRNPLAPISAAAQILKLSYPSAAQLKSTGDIITRQIEHLTGLVDDLLDVSRVTRGLITTRMMAINLTHVISEAVEQSNPLIHARQHTISIDLPAQDICINGDHKRMVQALTNLLINAAKYTPNGGHITIQLSATPDLAVLSVTDNGVGITPDLLPRVFDLFTQAERAVDRSQGGLGVGLALVKSLVEIHGGTVKAISKPGIPGSRFEMSLPRIDVAVTPEHIPPALTGSAKRIMVVDDNEDAANTLVTVLRILGHQASAVYTAQIAMAQAGVDKPDVFLLDIGLPDVDGNILVRYLRNQPTSANALIIAVTGYGAEENRRESMAAGFDEYLVKPIDMGELELLLNRYQ